jgi:hypothetical protein
MNSDQRNHNTQTEEIDLLVLAERGLGFLSRYKWVFIIATVAGIGLGLGLYSNMAKIYSSRMIVHSYLLANQEEIQIVNNWNQLLKKKEYTALAELLNVKEDVLYPVKKIEATEIQKVFTPNNPNGFLVEVNTTSNAILPELQQGIVYGLENTPYVKARTDIKRANLEQLIATTTIEIRKLDSSKAIVEKIMAGSGKASSSLIVDGSSINRQLIEMNEKLLGYKEGLKFANAVQVLQGFSQFKKPVGPHLLFWLVAGLVFCLALAWFFAFIDTIRRKLKLRASSRR